MKHNPRILAIHTQNQANNELTKIHCDPAGIGIMTPKTVFRTIKLEQVSAKAANLLKQTFLAKGGDAAIARGCADLSVDSTDVILSGTLKQYRQAVQQLKSQPWGLPELAKNIESVLQTAETFPERHYVWRDRKLDMVPGRTLVMGILNVTPDSFSDGGQFNSIDCALRHAEEMVRDGADIIDIGAESTRPYANSQKVSAEEEMERLLPVLERLTAAVAAPISVDTYKAAVAREALRRGAHIINDVWGLQHDPDMAAVAAEFKVPVIIMHNRADTLYQRDIMAEINEWLWRSIAIGVEAGISRENFIVDPGIGFGKTTDQNLEVMARLEEMGALGCPVLLAASRKRFIGEALDLPVTDRMEGTGATVCTGIAKGVQMVRVHDVKPIARMVRMMDALLRRQWNV